MTTREKILLVPLCAVLLVVALSWRLWLIALGFAVAAAAVVWLETEEGAVGNTPVFLSSLPKRIRLAIT